MLVITLLALALVPAWDHPGYDAEDSYYNPAEQTINATTIGKLTRQWSVPLRKQPDGSCSGPSAPLATGDRVIATDQRGITAYRAADGHPLWSFNWTDPGDATTPTMAITDGLLIAANGGCQSASDPNGEITALNLATGKVKWSRSVDTPADSLAVDKGVVVISGESPSDDQTTLAYRATDGRPLWTKPGATSSGVSANGRLLVTEARSTSALAITTGQPLWTKPSLWYAQSATPASDRFLVTTDTTLAAVNAQTGAVLWTAPGKASPLLATDGRRIYRSAGNAVEALTADTGRRAWAKQLTRPTLQPLRAGGLLYTGGPVLNAATGTIASSGTLFPGFQIPTAGHLYNVNGSTLTALSP